MKPSNALDIFAGHQRQARLWFWLFLITIIGFTAERWHLGASLMAETKIIVMDQDTYYLPKALDFVDAKDLHVSQAVLAVESLFGRHPGGLDHPERTKRLFNKSAYEEVIDLIDEERERFEAMEIHQKVEVASVRLVEAKDRSVVMAVEGQLIRSGIFGGRPLIETLLFKAHLTFVRNPNMVANGGYPTVVEAFETQTKPVE